MTYNVAAKVRMEKEQYPERFCPDPRCLWRIWTRLGAKPCPKHMGRVPQQEAPVSKKDMTQHQIGVAVVTGWRDAAIAACESAMVPLYERLIEGLNARKATLAAIQERTP